MAQEKNINAAAKAVEDQLLAIYSAATEKDKANVAALIKTASEATEASPDVMKLDVTPGMAALLFFDHNKQNRAWDYKLSQEYCRRILEEGWHFTNQGLGFLVTGDVGDGQHRLAGLALSGQTISQLVAIGMAQKAIRDIDSGRPRSGATALEIEHLEAGAIKHRILTRAYSILNRTDPKKKLRSNPQKIEAVYANNEVLTQSMTIGENSGKKIAKPTFNVLEAQILAFILLKSGWPIGRIVEQLALFQLGQDIGGGESSPLFVAAKLLEKDAAKRERVSATGRFGAAIKAFLLAEQGVSGCKNSDIREAMKPKNIPDPRYVEPEDVAA